MVIRASSSSAVLNLRPGGGTAQAQPTADDDAVSDADIAANAASIVDRVYAHITAWLTGNSHGAQIIMVDNEPPASVADFGHCRPLRRLDRSTSVRTDRRRHRLAAGLK